MRQGSSSESAADPLLLLLGSSSVARAPLILANRIESRYAFVLFGAESDEKKIRPTLIKRRSRRASQISDG